MDGPHILGIHHVTAIARDPQTNVDFYTGALGLRLVKLTVNFDDPGSYHLYYGDATGSPGSLLTFFAYDGFPGTPGLGVVGSVAFAVPSGALNYWSDRLSGHGLDVDSAPERLGESGVAFADPDGMRIELIGQDSAAAGGEWTAGGVPREFAISGVHSVSIPTVEDATAELFTNLFKWERRTVSVGSARFEGEARGAFDVLRAEEPRRGRVGVGSVHHVAFRVRTPDSQAVWRDKLVDAGLSVSGFMERDYFRSIYFREPGGALFEIATDGPGMAIDEPLDMLGSSLRLPANLEPAREAIERALPGLDLPVVIA